MARGPFSQMLGQRELLSWTASDTSVTGATGAIHRRALVAQQSASGLRGGSIREPSEGGWSRKSFNMPVRSMKAVPGGHQDMLEGCSEHRLSESTTATFIAVLHEMHEGPESLNSNPIQR